MKVIDLFAGCGGFSSGFLQAGFKIVKAVEYDEKIAETYAFNHKQTKLYIDDIKNVDNDLVFSKDDGEVIIGGPPCQGFSMAGARIRNGFIDDERNYLFKHYFNIVRLVKPKVFIMENVKGLLTMHSGGILNEILSLFSNPEYFNGDRYYLYPKVVNAKDFGIPQNRERLIIVGVLNHEIEYDQLMKKTKEEIKLYYNDFFEKVTVWDAIGNLEDATKDGFIKNPNPKTPYQKYLSSEMDMLENHVATNHSKKAIERMKMIKPLENYQVLNEEIKSVHSGSYGRLAKEEIANTITTRFDTPSGGRFIHPIFNRTLTPREAARIQSFPDDFVFRGTKSSISTQIGNAVPVKLAYFYGVMTRRIINECFNS